MGQEIDLKSGSSVDMSGFLLRLREETNLLAKWFQDGRFALCKDGYTVGLELEMWLVDKNFQPLAENKALIASIADPMLVPELSKFNAELNAPPERIAAGSLERIASQLKEIWQRIQQSMRDRDGHALTIGTLPTLKKSMLSLDSMSDFDRFRALNESVLNLRRGQALEIDIEGHEHLRAIHDNIMLEAGATSFQVHIQPPYELMNRTFNAAVIVSCASVALAANSPYLLGVDLWDETRIALFEQAVCLPGFTLLDGSRQQRVTFGSDYVQESLMDLFWENAHGFPVLLPFTSERAPEDLSHLALQNSTIWRWNRPVIGVGLDGQASLRVEHRVMGAGPSLDDMVADLAFLLGVCHELAGKLGKAQDFIPFAQARSNFYAAARYGLNARVSWADKGEISLRTLLLEYLLPAARRGLKSLKISDEEISYYLDRILEPRVASMQNGASWQRKWVLAHGKDLDAMTAAYSKNQESAQPVHTWAI